MSKQKNRQLRIIFIFVIAIFGIFLLLPTITLLLKSFITDNGISFESYMEMLGQKRFYKAFGNSLVVALFSGVLSTFLAFIMAYTINFTNLCKGIKSTIKTLGVLPMLLPTITYGFAIIYSFGKQGLITKLFGKQIFDIYGFKGLVLGYVIYTLPIAFILINNTMLYIDKSFITVSRIMGDSKIRTLWIAVISPLLGTLAAAVIQCFFLSFTDFGIPASIGGEYEVVATLLFNEMLGSVPNFNNGAVIALSMLLPSILSISLLTYLEKYNIRYNKISQPEIKKNKVRDFVCGGLSIVIILIMLSIFAVIVVVPFAEEWPYRIVFSMKNLNNVFSDRSLIGVFTNSILVSVLTALFGTLIAYCGALISSRSKLKFKGTIEKIALITNTIPGMVLGIAFLLVFTGTPIQNTFFIIIICNIVHFFSTPYLMLKGTLEKMNSSWETTAMLMGDSWIKTIIRIVTPNAMPTILQVFEYYFVNAMVTVSAIIFLVGARTSVITTKIKELQHISKFNEIFVLSLLLLLTNIAVKIFIKLYMSF
jgi:iron(III) transport system permease protein